MVCTRSAVIAAASEDSFLQAKTKVIDINVADASTVKRLIKYLYEGDYDDGMKSLDTKEAEASLETQADEPAISVDTDSDSIVWTKSDHDDKADSAHEEPSGGKINAALVANAQVYITADYYQISKLKSFALAKFRDASRYRCEPGFERVVAFVCSTTSRTARELRSLVCSAVIRDAKSLIPYDQQFMEAVVQFPDFMKEVLPNLVAEYECRLDMVKMQISNWEKSTDAQKQSSMKKQKKKSTV
ncbi:MAG: hypothetical protein Q9167_006997 [Letrouitia subvulpina]